MRRHDRIELGEAEKRPAIAVGAVAVGTRAIGPTAMAPVAVAALAVGAVAVGAVAIGRLSVKRAQFACVEIDELLVRRLRVEELEVVRDVSSPQPPPPQP